MLRASSDAERAAVVKDGINDYVVDGRADAVNPDAHGDEGVGALRADGRPAGERRSCNCGFSARRRRIAGLFGIDVRRCSASGSPRPTSSTRRSRPPDLSRRRASG